MVVSNLHEAVTSTDCTPETIRNMVREEPDSLNRVDGNRRTALHLALFYVQPIEVIHELLKLGAEVNLLAGNFTPLHYAVRYYGAHEALVDIVQLLIKFGSNVNLRENSHNPPIYYLFLNVKGYRLIKTLDILLRNGATTERLRPSDRNGQDFCSYLEFAFSNVQKLSTRLEISKMLLEYGAKPDKHIQHMRNYNIDFFKEINPITIQFMKLRMQYILINEMKTDISKDERRLRRQYDEITNLNDFKGKKCFKKLTDYRNCLIKEIIMMHRDIIGEKRTLFSFISERCGSGLSFHESEEPLLCGVISAFHSNRYVCCDDLFRASIKHEALMSVISKTCIYAKKSIPNSSSTIKVILTSDAVLKIASYLTRQDVLNLTLAYWVPAEQNDGFPVKNYNLRKRTSSSNISLSGSSKTVIKRLKRKK